MADKRTGRASTFERLTPTLATFRLQPADGLPFPEYKAGQYMALSRDDCKLTRRVVGPDGKAHYEPDLDAAGEPRRGTVTHSYSIASAPWETRELGHLEFYIVLEVVEQQYPGRLTESFFRVSPPHDDRVGYVDRIAGDFTLDKRAAGARNVVMVGTGTGLAPFVAMAKELDHEARAGRTDGVRYTLFHANRTADELAYHMLRRQILRSLRKPLIVMTPKSLLRHDLSVSSLEDLANGEFATVIDEVDKLQHANVKRVVLSSGKVYFDLLKARRTTNNNEVALVRVEQLYPFPVSETEAVLAKYPNAREVVWCQEEPQNQGAWYQIRHRLQTLVGKRELLYAGRPPAAAPATGITKVHELEQRGLIEAALSATHKEDGARETKRLTLVGTAGTPPAAATSQ